MSQPAPYHLNSLPHSNPQPTQPSYIWPYPQPVSHWPIFPFPSNPPPKVTPDPNPPFLGPSMTDGPYGPLPTVDWGNLHQPPRTYAPWSGGPGAPLNFAPLPLPQYQSYHPSATVVPPGAEPTAPPRPTTTTQRYDERRSNGDTPKQQPIDATQVDHRPSSATAYGYAATPQIACLHCLGNTAPGTLGYVLSFNPLPVPPQDSPNAADKETSTDQGDREKDDERIFVNGESNGRILSGITGKGKMEGVRYSESELDEEE